jgi:hypothetical protein
MKVTSQTIQTLYDADYQLWLTRTVQQLRDSDYDNIDWDNLVEEIEAMGKRDKQRLESNLIIVLLHLLKWQFQPQKRSGSWEASIIEHRRRIHRSLEDSPSLKAYLEATLNRSYQSARKQAKAETGLSLETFPNKCPYSVVEVLDEGFYPGRLDIPD